MRVKIGILNGNHFGWIGLQNRDWLVEESDLVYIGRSHKAKQLRKSPVENPYRERQFGNTECIQMFRKHLWSDIKKFEETGEKSELVQGVLELAAIAKSGKELKLVCFCRPERCHGDIIRNFIEWAIIQELV